MAVEAVPGRIDVERLAIVVLSPRWRLAGHDAASSRCEAPGAGALSAAWIPDRIQEACQMGGAARRQRFALPCVGQG